MRFHKSSLRFKLTYEATTQVLLHFLVDSLIMDVYKPLTSYIMRMTGSCSSSKVLYLDAITVPSCDCSPFYIHSNCILQHIIYFLEWNHRTITLSIGSPGTRYFPYPPTGCQNPSKCGILQFNPSQCHYLLSPHTGECQKDYRTFESSQT